MSEITFRELEASDVEVRVAQVSEGKGISLLLYKDARCDMRLLDDAVGADRWQCEYQRIGDTLFCNVGIRDELGEWVWKQDCGVPSATEATKGEASDAFKRACFKWGIGRSLYTAPFIWVPAELCNIGKNKQGKPACYDRFIVTKMVVEEGRITKLAIANAKTGQTVYPSSGGGKTPQSKKSANAGGEKAPQEQKKPVKSETEKHAGYVSRVKQLRQEAIDAGIKPEGIDSYLMSSFGESDPGKLTLKELECAGKHIKGLIAAKEELNNG